MRATVVRLVLLVGLLLFFFFANLPERSQFWRAFFDAGHTPLFGVIALLIRGLLEGRGRLLRSRAFSSAGLSVAAFALTMVLGAATELVQMVFRLGDPSVSDLLRDAAGAASFLLLASAVHRRSAVAFPATTPGGETAAPARARHRRIVAVVAALVLLLAAGRTLIVTTAAYVERSRAFPTLYALDGAWWEGMFIRTATSRLTPAGTPGAAEGPDGRPTTLARLDLRAGRYPGLTFLEPYPDWRGYHRLTFTVVSDLDAPITLAMRVHDAKHDQRYRDRFNRAFTIRPGTNRLAIVLEDVRRAPAGREMDMRRIRGIVLFVPRLARPTHLYLGPLQLE